MQLILPYKISCTWGSSEIPLLSLLLTWALLRAVTVFQNIHLLPHVLTHPQVNQFLGEAKLAVHQLSCGLCIIRVQVRFLWVIEL